MFKKNPVQQMAILSKKVYDKYDFSKIDTRRLVDIGNECIRLMRDRISRGISPLGTGGRFPAYKNPKRYPGKRKPKRPVNLKLTGQFLSSLDAKALRGKKPKITIFFSNDTAKKKEKGHRDGAGGQPKRPIMPVRKEKLSDGIRVKLGRYIKKVLDEALRLDKRR